MQVLETTAPIFIYNVVDHKEHKEMLLNAINLFINSKDSELDESHGALNTTIHSDWNSTRGDYLQYFYKHIVSLHITKITQNLNLQAWEIDNGWFQQYTEMAEHVWHTHPNTQFTNVYYLELPDNEYVTELLDINQQPIMLKAQEGDIVTFPSYLLHRSKPNGKERKTIISYNSSFALND